MRCTELPTATTVNFLPSFPVVRKDWMDRLGGGSGTADTGRVPRPGGQRFTHDDPDGNGKNDTFGVHDRSDYDRSRFSYIFAAHGVSYFAYELIDGKVTFTPQSDNWKEALRFVRDLYAAGAIDPEFLTDKRDQQRKKWAAGMFGILWDNAWWMISSTKGNVLDMVRDQNPQAEFAYVGHLQGPDHGRGPLTSQPIGLYTDASAHFGAKTSDEKVKAHHADPGCVLLRTGLLAQGTLGRRGSPLGLAGRHSHAQGRAARGAGETRESGSILRFRCSWTRRT